MNGLISILNLAAFTLLLFRDVSNKLNKCISGFLLDFISLPVITGFTAAASINIATSQFKPLLGIAGRSEDLVDSLVSVFSNLNSIRYQDTLLGIATIVALVLFKVNFYNGRDTIEDDDTINVQCSLLRNFLNRMFMLIFI